MEMKEVEVRKVLFDDYFILNETNWPKIKRVFEMFGTMKSIVASSPSKDIEQGDGSMTPFNISFSNTGCLVKMYQTAKKLGILKDDSLKITFSALPTKEEKKALEVWMGLTSSYSSLKEIEQSKISLRFSMAPMLRSDEILFRSPAQLLIYSNSSSNVNLVDILPSGDYGSRLYKVPWDTMDKLLPDVMERMEEFWSKDYFGEFKPLTIIYEEKKGNVTFPLPPIAEEGQPPPPDIPKEYNYGQDVFCITYAKNIGSEPEIPASSFPLCFGSLKKPNVLLTDGFGYGCADNCPFFWLM
jgi:hypothetical protein